MTKTNAQNNRTKQPKGLYLLFFTGLWERFGFYTLQTIIILYMTKGLALSDHTANLLYAAFSALLYITPMIGGYLADRYLGFQRSVIIGGLLLVLAYALASFQDKSIFFLGLGTLICANGLFKPTLSCIVGDLYPDPNDPRRDGGFTLFYMGINIGALIPPLIAGTLVVHFGWHSGFIAAAIGMMIGQFIFILGRKHLPAEIPTSKYRTQRTQPSLLFYFILMLGILLFIAASQLAFRYPEITNNLVEIASIVISAVIIFFIFREPIKDRKKMLACLILIIISIAFWALYNQTFTSLMLFADRNMEKNFLGIPLDAEATQFFNPFFIILLSPFLSRLWIRMDNAGLNPSIQMKFSLGIVFMSAGYFVLALGAYFFGNEGMTSAGWLCSSYLLQTIGELLLSPIGLAMITVLCPKHLVGMMMGVWFFSQAASFTIGGMLANIAALPSTQLSAAQSLPIYSHAFGTYSALGLLMALISFSLIPFLNRMTKMD